MNQFGKNYVDSHVIHVNLYDLNQCMLFYHYDVNGEWYGEWYEVNDLNLSHNFSIYVKYDL